MSTEEPRLQQILETLTDRWGERRALRPLAILLQGITALESHALTAPEQELPAEARRLVNGALRAVGPRPT